mgnify:CR=1 FL=1
MGREKFSALTCCQSGPCRKEKRSRQSYTRILENWCDSGEFLHDKKYQQTQGVDKDHRYLMQPILIENVDGEDKYLPDIVEDYVA